MKNKEEKDGIIIDVKVNIDAIRAAAKNAAKVQDVALEVPVVNPRDLSVDDEVFGIILQPILATEKKNPDTTLYTAVRPIIVDTLSGRVKPGFIVVNGTIDIPRETGKITTIENCYFSDKNYAKAVCRAITEVQLERSLEKQAIEKRNSEFLQEQLNADRF
jgi:hypothetical protein